VRALVVSNMLADERHPERGRFVRDQVAALRELRELGAANRWRDEAPDQRSETPDQGSDETPGHRSAETPSETYAETPGWGALGELGGSQAGGPEALEELDVELYEFAPGAGALLRAARELRRRYRGERFDVVHAHFGLTAWPALAVRARKRALTLHGTDLAHPRTRLATRALLPAMGLVATASEALIAQVPGGRTRARAQALPCGVDTERFQPIERARARAALDLPARAPLLLFPADPARSEKRHDRARALAEATGARLLTLGGVAPERVPLYVNAANAVVVPSEREGFGLAVLEALACDVPVLATPVGVHPRALEGIAGTLCAPFDLRAWRERLAPQLAAADPRVAGRRRAEQFSARRMAERVAGAWRTLVADAG
jgi:teichuronic acid biosynthesis glycosyltransferase TuaC